MSESRKVGQERRSGRGGRGKRKEWTTRPPLKSNARASRGSKSLGFSRSFSRASDRKVEKRSTPLSGTTGVSKFLEGYMGRTDETWGVNRTKPLRVVGPPSQGRGSRKSPVLPFARDSLGTGGREVVEVQQPCRHGISAGRRRFCLSDYSTGAQRDGPYVWTESPARWSSLYNHKRRTESYRWRRRAKTCRCGN